MSDYDPYDENPYSSQDVRFIPVIKDYESKYAKSMEGNDLKALRTFRDYESSEKVRRLQQELQWIKGDMVAEDVLDEVIGKKRKSKWQSYSQWASMMLQWLASCKK